MTSWRAFYASDFQSLWALVALPFAFLVYRLVRGGPARDASAARESRFMAAYTLVWTVETLVDPVAGGPLVRALGWQGSLGATVLMFTFVLLGDLRVFALVFGLARPQGWPLRTLGFGLIVPLFAGGTWWIASSALPALPGQTLWLVYELAFAAIAVWLARAWLPRQPDVDPALRAMLVSCLAYVAAYYALWAACDVLILSGIDEGWGLRALPNQLYYALWVPFVHARHAFARSRTRATSTSAQASR